MMKYPLRIQFSNGLGTGLIIALGLFVTAQLYMHGVEHSAYSNNYTTNLLLSDSLTETTGAAPWAIFSLNWFLCKTAVKKWRGFICSYFA